LPSLSFLVEKSLVASFISTYWFCITELHNLGNSKW